MKPAFYRFPLVAIHLLLMTSGAFSRTLGTLAAGAESAASIRTLPSPTTDSDGDGLTDLEEYYYGSNPRVKDTDGDGKSDWEEAHNMLNPNQSPWADAKLIDRFRFNTSDGKTDEGRLPLVTPPANQFVDSFEEKAVTFPTTGSIPIVYRLEDVPLDLAYGTVRFWYIPDAAFTDTDSEWRTLLHARGNSATSLVAEWLLELQPSTRSIVMKSSVGTSGELRENFVGKLPPARASDLGAFEICLSYTPGSTWLAINGYVINSEVVLLRGNVRGLGVDLAGVKALNASSTRRLAIGGRIQPTTDYDRPARGRIDDLEWFNCALFNPVPFTRAATPWGVTRNSADLRKSGGWANPTADGRGIEIHLRRGWEGPLSTVPREQDPYRILRREWGTPGTDAWQTLPQGTRQNTIIDTDVTPGKWYEYRLPANSPNYAQPIWGYAGPTRPALTSGPGYAIVVGLDQELLSWEAENGTLHTAIREYVAQLKREFGADRVRTVELQRMQDDPDFNGQLDPKSGPVSMFEVGTADNNRYKSDLRDNKNAISNEFRYIGQDSLAEKLVVLIGHVTVPLSGTGAEDGHRTPFGISSFESPRGSQKRHPVYQSAHFGAWPCDLWYGDYDVTWTDTQNLSEGKSAFINGAPRIDWQARNVAGDGKFDHSKIPPNSAGVVNLDAGVGRMDFSKMPGALKPEDGTGAQRFRNAELRMTAGFLTKTLAFHRNDPRDTRQRPTVHEVQLLCGSPRRPAIPVDMFANLGVPALAVSVRQFDGTLPDSAWTDLFNASGLSMWGFHGHYGAYNKLSGTWDNPIFSEHILANTRWCHSVLAGFMGSFFGDWNHEPENLYPPYDISEAQPLTMSAGNILKTILTQPQGGLVVFYQPTGLLDFSRAAVGFPAGIFLRDSLAWHPDTSCRTLYLLGDPTIITK